MANEPAPAPAAIDLNNYVPKSDFERLQTQAADATKGLETLKNQLLDKDYLDFLEAKRSGNNRPSGLQAGTPNLENVDLKNLDMKGLVQLIQQHSLAVVTQAVGPQLQKLTGAITDVQAVLELDQARQKYEDFDDFSKDVTAILEHANNDLTIEQAYLMARAQKPPAAPDAGKPPAKAPGQSERPGSVVPLEGETVKTFKSPEAASQAALSEVMARHGLSGDSI